MQDTVENAVLLTYANRLKTHTCTSNQLYSFRGRCQTAPNITRKYFNFRQFWTNNYFSSWNKLQNQCQKYTLHVHSEEQFYTGQ